MTQKQTVFFLLSFLIVSTALRFLIRYFNIQGEFSPLITTVLFILINKKDKFKMIGFKGFNVMPLLILGLVYVTLELLEKLIQLKTGTLLYNHNLKDNVGINILIYFVFGFLIIGLTEEIAWRGYLFSKLKHLTWIQIVLSINIVWAIWHLPSVLDSKVPFSYINFLFFIINCVEFGILLLYLRLKTKSVIACGLLHAIPVVFQMVDNNIFSISDPFWGSPRTIIASLIALPIAYIFYIKGQRIYEQEKINNVA
jgi:membrane protease YdiL (CAAX protease family)